MLEIDGDPSWMCFCPTFTRYVISILHLSMNIPLRLKEDIEKDAEN